MNTLPMEMKGLLNSFIVEFTEAMNSQKSDKMAESIAKLSKAMESLGIKLEDSSLVNLQMNTQVVESADQIKAIYRQLLQSGVLKPPKPQKTGAATTSPA